MVNFFSYRITYHADCHAIYYIFFQTSQVQVAVAESALIKVGLVKRKFKNAISLQTVI